MRIRRHHYRRHYRRYNNNNNIHHHHSTTTTIPNRTPRNTTTGFTTHFNTLVLIVLILTVTVLFHPQQQSHQGISIATVYFLFPFPILVTTITDIIIITPISCMPVTHRGFYYSSPTFRHLLLHSVVPRQQQQHQRHIISAVRATSTNFQNSWYSRTTMTSSNGNPNRKRKVKLSQYPLYASTMMTSSLLDHHHSDTTTITTSSSSSTLISMKQQQQQQQQQQSFVVLASILHHFVSRCHPSSSTNVVDDTNEVLLLLTQVQHQLNQFLKDHSDSISPLFLLLLSSPAVRPEAAVSSSIMFPNTVDTDTTNKEHSDIQASISHLVQQIHIIFCEMARTSSSKDTRMKLRHLASNLLVTPPQHPSTPTATVTAMDPITTSLLTVSLILTSLSIHINAASIELQQQQQHQQQVCRSAASAIGSAMEEFLQNHPNYITNNPHGVMTLRHFVLSILTVHRNIMTTMNTSTTTTTADTDTDTSTVTEMTATHDGTLYMDFHIITNLARLLGMENCYCCGTSNMANNHNIINDADDSILSDVVTFVITNGLQLSYGDANNIMNNHDGKQVINGEAHSLNSNVGTIHVPTGEVDQIRSENVETNDIDTLTTMISFASQFRPWHRIDPIQLIHIAMDHLLWHSAEKICTSVTTVDPNYLMNATQIGIDAVSTYVDITIQLRAHRQADKIATAFFDVFAVGIDDNLLERYFLNARYLHACNTIVKLIRRGAIPVIERQVERIDQSVLKIKENREIRQNNNDVKSSVLSVNNGAEPYYEGGTTLECASMDIRNFALHKLEESDEMDTALRFATIWGMDYVMDPEVMKLAEQRRKESYIQWEDLFPHQPKIPDLITTPEALDHAMMIELGSTHTVYGFDVEWGNDDDTGDVGAALLQIATTDNVILVDIPTLSKTALGVEALERHINTLFHNPNINVVGFSCREDITKLRNSPCIRKDRHWFQSDQAVGKNHSIIDLQTMIARLEIEQLPKDHFGLSRVCEYYLMKPLDKSEQCSEWNQRPLSVKQRIYAALDAYVCAIVYEKLMKLDHSTVVHTTITTNTMKE